ncbi:MAG: transglycosylase SLT domain-containing protein [Candidatus Binataceae bacterium]
MKAKRWMWLSAAMVVPAALLCAAARVPAMRTSAARVPAMPAGVRMAQIFGPRIKVVPIDPAQAFVEGYQAYRNHDTLGAIERFQFASRSFPDLADYALYYLGMARQANGELQPAADSFRDLYTQYPQSVMARDATLHYAQLEGKLNRPDLAIAAANRVIGASPPSIDQQARLVAAQAMAAQGDYRGAYDEARVIRGRYPTGAADSSARQLAYSLLRDHPGLADTSSLPYLTTEAALLVREARPTAALVMARRALALSPPLDTRAELVWIEAEASRANAMKARGIWLEYLTLAPTGPHAPAALNALAHSYWHVGDTGNARLYFGRLVRGFPHSGLVPYAMFEIGRTYEDDGALTEARAAYQRLARRYPLSESADSARFRAPFMLYMMKRYAQAASEFADMRERAETGSRRDMFMYWEARALEGEGESAHAREMLARVAGSTASNYYPELATLRTHVRPASFPAATAPDLAVVSPPAVTGASSFHMTRVLAMRRLGLRELEPGELLRLEHAAAGNPDLRDFVLTEFQAVDAWYDAILMATRMSDRGELSHPMAERIRYPRAYWPLISSSAASSGLDPYLVMALIRQESLFDPNARSVSDARGLMQLLPTTAERFASLAALTASPLNLYDPAVSVELGTTYLKSLFAMFADDRFKAVAAYNAGEHAVAGWAAKYPGDDDQWVENIGYRETRDYVKKVIGGVREYRMLYADAYGKFNSTPAPPS